ncbi:MAG: T9SS type A sorting domain-containing protein [Bacteroidetes bacterium]|nr:T9SS type A sorting domain-containing protein [Bacteroidota bacterium]
MKYILPFIALIFFYSSVGAQSSSIQWQLILGGSNGEVAMSVIPTSDGGYISAGSTTSMDGDIIGNHGINWTADVWIIKFDSTGIIQWQKLLGGSMSDGSSSIRQTNDGGYIFAGYTLSVDGDVTGNDGGLDFWVVKLDSEGNIMWQKTYGGPGADYGNSIRQTPDGGYVVAGSCQDNGGDVTGFHGDRDYWVIKISPDGTLEWQKALGGSDDDQAQGVIVTSDGNFLVTGFASSTDGDVTGMMGCYDMWLVKLSSSGDIIWKKTFGGSSCDNGNNITKTSDGGCLLVGRTGSAIPGFHGYSDYYVVKLNAAGTMEWQKAFGGSEMDEAYDAQQTIDGGYVVTGVTYSNNGDITTQHGGGDVWIIKLNASGILQWQKTFGGSQEDLSNSIFRTADNGFIIGAHSQSSDGDLTINKGYIDLWIMKLVPDPMVGIRELPENVKLISDPGGNEIRFFLPGDATADKVVIMDMNGKSLVSLENKQNRIETNKLPSGLYFLKLFSGNAFFYTKFIK